MTRVPSSKSYVVVDVGCIECGEKSAIVGAYSSHDAADLAAAELAEGNADGSGGPYNFYTPGHHYAQVFEVPEVSA